MSSVDERVVKMRFDNSQFKKAAGETQQQLATMDKSVASAGKNRGLLDMAGHMETVKVKASAMQVAVATAIANIANRAVNAGVSMAKSLSVDPIKAGFDEYELKMKSIQTILANTKGENLKSVSKSLAELNEYSDKTIYNFANMTDNIGKLTTAGISLDDATATVKGFSNMVALAGGDATAAAGAMEQFGMGLQAGAIKAMDWMSISNRGLGSQSLQKAFFETARAAGALQDVPLTTTFEEWSKSQGGFKASLETGWLTTETATETLKIMTGDIKNVQQLTKMGFDPKVAKDMLKIANNALNSATKVRTLTAFMDTLQEQIGSGWSQMIEIIFGDFNEATKMFTKLSNLTGDAIGTFFNYIGTLLKGWDEMGGRTAILDTIKNLLAPIGAILKVVAKAWSAAFPSGKTGSGLASLSKGLELLTRPLLYLAELISGAAGPITTFFKMFHIGVTIVKSAIGWITNLAKSVGSFIGMKVGGAGGGIMDFFKSLGSSISGAIDYIDKMIRKGESLRDIFSNLEFKMPKMPDLPGIDGLMGKTPDLPSMDSAKGLLGKVGLPSAPKNPFGDAAVPRQGPQDVHSKASSTIRGMTFNPDASLDGSRVRDVGDSVSSGLEESSKKIDSAGSTLGSVFDKLWAKISGFFDKFTFEDLTSSFNLAVLATMAISISKFLNTMSDSFGGFAGVGRNFNGVLESASDALKGFQTGMQAKLILNIAIAIAILAAALWVLSKIPEDQLAAAVIAMAGAAAIMKVSMKAFADTVEQLDGRGINGKMLALGASMVLFAIAILILASAMKKMNDVEWKSVLFATVAITALSLAMKTLAKLDSEGIVKTALALAVTSVGLMLFAAAIEKFAGLDFKVFAEGMIYAGVALGTLTFFLHQFESSLSGAAAMVVAIGALWLFIRVIERFSAMDWGVFGKGIALAAASLLVLVVAMHGFQSSLAGAAALVVAVGALFLLVDVLEAFAALDWGVFGKGIAMITIAFVVLGGLMALLGFFSPLILLGAAAILMFGASLFLLGAGIMLIAKGLATLILISGGIIAAVTAFATAAAVGFAIFVQTLAMEAPLIKKAFLDILQSIIDGIVEAVPMVIDGVKRLWAAIQEQFQGSGGNQKQAFMGNAGKSWIQKLKDAIVKKIPDLVRAARDIVVKFVTGLASKAGTLAAAGVTLIVSLINGITSKVGDIVTAAVGFIIAFADGLGDNIGRLAKAGVQLIADWLHGLATAIRTGSQKISDGITDVVDAFYDVGVDLVQGLIDGIKSLASKPKEWIAEIVDELPKWAKKLLKIQSPSRVFFQIGAFLVQGLTNGIQNHAAGAIKATASMIGGSIALATEYVNGFIQKLEQKAIAAQSTADGLQAAASRAAASAERTKSNKDDKAAQKLQGRADRASTRAEEVAQRLEDKKFKAERAEEYKDANTARRAEMEAENAAISIEEAKLAESKAISAKIEADALRKQAKVAGVTKKERKKLLAQAKKLDKQVENQGKKANDYMDDARGHAGKALELQKLAGEEAAKLFQEQFDAEAKSDAEDAAFEKLSSSEKAAKRRQQAAALQAKANKDLADAKILALTDLDAANALAKEAMTQAEQARKYIKDAEGYEESARGGDGTTPTDGVVGEVVNLAITDAASAAFNRYSQRYSAGVAAAAAERTIQFNQYNTSPESLSPSEIYRQSNNLLSHAADKLQTTAA